MKRIAIVLILLFIAAPAFAGLKEKRATKNFQEKALPELQKQIDAAAGFPVKVEVDWESLAVEKYADSYDKFWTKIYFTPLIEALKAICTDDMGKTALKDALKKVVIQNKSGQHSYRGFSFKDGVLTLDHRAAANVGQVKDRTDGLIKLIEKSL